MLAAVQCTHGLVWNHSVLFLSCKLRLRHRVVAAAVATAAAEKPPHWARFLHPPAGRRTRVFASPTLPDIKTVVWEANQHSSPTLRPADFVVYVVDANVRDDRARFLDHVAVQAQETLHAIMLYGNVCGKDFK